MTNLNKILTKIYKNQLFERLNSYGNLNLISSISTDFYHANIFLEKRISEKFKSNLNITLFEKTVSETDFDKSINLFSIKSIDSNDVIKSDVSDH